MGHGIEKSSGSSSTEANETSETNANLNFAAYSSRMMNRILLTMFPMTSSLGAAIANSLPTNLAGAEAEAGAGTGRQRSDDQTR